MAAKATPTAPPGDIFDTAIRGALAKSAAKRAAPAKSPPDATAPDSKLVDKFVALLTPLDDTKRASYVAAFNAAVDRLSNTDENEPTAAPEEAEPPSVTA